MPADLPTLAEHAHLFLPGSDPAAPPFLLLHGTGGSERDLVPLASRLSPGSALLCPRGNVMENGARRFFRRFGEGRLDLDDVRDRTTALARFVDAAAERYHFVSTTLIALGFSNGANMAVSLLQLQPQTLGGSILLRPMVVWPDPAPAGSLSRHRVLIASGELDPLVPNDQPPRLAELLKKGGADVSINFSTASHGLVAADFEACERFMYS